ncbi:polysialyltransferase family glycosyltransferase [Pseudoalteromonas sp. B62]|uniref:polysialyltransferase family glycosyltransferase n=1 Tax=Pseudoalteromonas sp. B62 TaxID=630483 RepID=UPI00301CB573
MIVFSVASVWHALVAKSISEAEGYKNAIYILEPASQSVYERVSLIVGEQNLFYLGEKKSGLKSGIEVLKLKLNPPINPLEIEQLYYFCPWSPYQRVFCHFSKNATIIRVEDGIRDYLDIPFDLHDKSLLNRSVKTLLGLSSFYEPDSSKYFLNDNALFFFPELLSEDFIKINSLQRYSRALVGVLMGMGLTVEASKYLDGLNKNEKTLLFIGQSLCEDKSLSIEDECEIYGSYINQKLLSGNNVVFKPHPRTSKDKKKLLLEKIILSDKGKFLYIETNDMVEQLLVNYKFNEVVGLWSIPVLYSSFLFGVKAKSLMALASNYASDAHISKIHTSLLNKFSIDYYDPL